MLRPLPCTPHTGRPHTPRTQAITRLPLRAGLRGRARSGHAGPDDAVLTAMCSWPRCLCRGAHVDASDLSKWQVSSATTLEYVNTCACELDTTLKKRQKISANVGGCAASCDPPVPARGCHGTRSRTCPRPCFSCSNPVSLGGFVQDDVLGRTKVHQRPARLGRWQSHKLSVLVLRFGRVHLGSVQVEHSAGNGKLRRLPTGAMLWMCDSFHALYT